MAFSVTIQYTAANDILNAKKEVEGVVTPAPYQPIPTGAPSDAYIYAPEGSTKPVFNKENLITTDANGNPVATNTYVTAGYNTSGQRRWPKSVTGSIKYILEAYATPQVPVYRAWQTIKMAITGDSYNFTTESLAEAEFYKEAGKALTDYGITVTVAESETAEDGGEG